MLINWQHFNCVIKPLLPCKGETQESHGKDFVFPAQKLGDLIYWQKSSILHLRCPCLADLETVVLHLSWTSRKSALMQALVVGLYSTLWVVSPCFWTQCPLEPLISSPPSEASLSRLMFGFTVFLLSAALIPACVRISWSYCQATFYSELTINICPCPSLKKFKPGVATFSWPFLPLHISENHDVWRSLRMPAST